MGAMASQITSLTNVCSTVYSGTDQGKHLCSASLALVRGIHRWPVISPHKVPVTRKMFPFDAVIMHVAIQHMCQFVLGSLVFTPEQHLFLWDLDNKLKNSLWYGFQSVGIAAHIRSPLTTWWRHHFPRYWPFMRGIYRWPVNSPHKGQWRGAFMFSLICAWINGWVNNRQAGDLKRHRAHCDVSVMRWD